MDGGVDVLGALGYGGWMQLFSFLVFLILMYHFGTFPFAFVSSLPLVGS